MNMYKCPKCSTEYGNDQKICRVCGAILEAVPGESQPAAEDDADEVSSGEQPSWKCAQCGKLVPGGFEVCWNCGTGADGMPDPGFVKEPEDRRGGTRVRWTAGRGNSSARTLQCPRCGSRKIIPDARILDLSPSSGNIQVAVDADPDALIFKDRRYDSVSADVCGKCGHVELKVEHAKELYEHYMQSQDKKAE